MKSRIKKKKQGAPPTIPAFLKNDWWLVIANPTRSERNLFAAMELGREALTLQQLKSRLPKANIMIFDFETYKLYVKNVRALTGYSFISHKCKAAIVL